MALRPVSIRALVVSMSAVGSGVEGGWGVVAGVGAGVACPSSRMSDTSF